MNEGTDSTGDHGFLPEPAGGASQGPARGGFSTTQWSVIIAAAGTSDERAHMAMEELCRTYWYPLYAHVRRCGHSKEDAEDLTQAFFARLLENNPLGGLDPGRGRFRSFLLAALKHFLANEWDKSRRLKRGGGVTVLSLDWQDAESRYRMDPADHLSPDKLYDRAWAVTLLERVVRKLESAYAGSESFRELKPCLTAGKGEIDHAAVAARLGMSEGAVRVAAHRLRRQYRELLRAEISGTLADPEQLADEMNALYSAFAD